MWGICILLDHMPQLKETTKCFKQIACLKKVSKAIVDIITAHVKMPPTQFKFITQTLKPHMYKCNIQQQFNRSITSLVSILDYIAKDYCLITELTDEGNVHYHFWIVFKDNRNYIDYKEMINANYTFGFSTLTKVKYQKTTAQQQIDCYNYMIKSLENTYRFVRSKGIVVNYDDHSQYIDLDEVQDVKPLNTDKIDANIKQLDL